MQRSKQQALMFLLGAVLVGGVLGFSADRVMSKKPQRMSARMSSYFLSRRWPTSARGRMSPSSVTP